MLATGAPSVVLPREVLNVEAAGGRIHERERLRTETVTIEEPVSGLATVDWPRMRLA